MSQYLCLPVTLNVCASGYVCEREREKASVLCVHMCDFMWLCVCVSASFCLCLGDQTSQMRSSVKQ